tara:strand:+ start:319749 stop:320954 length:1206 start_codon:yes stop_codon:yes gene_type:complete
MARKVQPDVESFARIRVVGVGGSGNNAVNHMINSKVKGVEFIAINTDAQDLHRSLAKRKIHIGKNVTRGLGAGGHPDTGQRAAEETREEIQEALKGSDMVFVTCGMGGGTGTGAAPVIARIAQEVGALTVAVVTKPFSFEGQQRTRTAEHGLAVLKDSVDAHIAIPNDKLLTIVDQNTTSKSAFAMCDDILRQAVEGVSDIITTAGEINTDFNDIKSVMEAAGPALMGIGIADGDTRAKDAAEIAINSPLLDVSISGAKGVLLAVAGSDDLGILEVQEAAKVVTEAVDTDAKIIFGIMKDEKLKKGHIRVIVIATGFPEKGSNVVPERNTSLFSLPRKEQEDERDRIYNSVIPKSKEVTEEKKEEVPVVEEPLEEEVIEDEDDNQKDNLGGAIPSFLRRNK